MTPPVEMTKGRAALPATVVAEQDPFFIALGGPKAHDCSSRDDNSYYAARAWRTKCDRAIGLSSRPQRSAGTCALFQPLLKMLFDLTRYCLLGQHGERGFDKADGVRHAGVPRGRAGHLRGVSREDHFIEVVLLQDGQNANHIDITLVYKCL